MKDLVERIVRWKIHPEDLVANGFPLEKADEAYALMASGKSGKVAVGGYQKVCVWGHNLEIEEND